MSDGRGGRSWRLVRADTDAVPTSVRRFMARARQRRLRAALPWAVTAGALLAVGALAWMVYGTSVLGVRMVEVVGTDSLSALQVREAAAVRLEQPLAGVDLARIRGRVESLPAVSRAVVSRSWPSTVVIEVVERTPVAAVPRGKEFTLIDAEGVAYRTVARRPSGLPVAQLAAPGPEDINTRSALTVLAALTAELREQLVSISVPKPAQVRLGLRKDRTVIWGDETQSETKARVATVLLERKGNTIDVSAPDVVTIR
jgi:cell division protein FtsQ